MMAGESATCLSGSVHAVISPLQRKQSSPPAREEARVPDGGFQSRRSTELHKALRRCGSRPPEPRFTRRGVLNRQQDARRSLPPRSDSCSYGNARDTRRGHRRSRSIQAERWDCRIARRDFASGLGLLLPSHVSPFALPSDSILIVIFVRDRIAHVRCRQGQVARAADHQRKMSRKRGNPTWDAQNRQARFWTHVRSNCSA